jgi:hypothetical protein
MANGTSTTNSRWPMPHARPAMAATTAQGSEQTVVDWSWRYCRSKTANFSDEAIDVRRPPGLRLDLDQHRGRVHQGHAER